MAFSPDGRLLVAALDFGKVRLWDPATGETLLTLDHSMAMRVAFSPDGHLLASASTNGTIRLWNLRSLLVLWNGTAPLLSNGPAPSARAALSSEALQRLWGLRFADFDLVPDRRPRPAARDGYYVDQEIDLGEEFPELKGRTRSRA